MCCSGGFGLAAVAVCAPSAAMQAAAKPITIADRLPISSFLPRASDHADPSPLVRARAYTRSGRAPNRAAAYASGSGTTRASSRLPSGLITAIPSYNEALGMLAAKAAEGFVTAVVALERALRNVREEEQDEVGDVIDRIIAEKRSDRT
jgi:hypothetical protein